MKRIFFVILIGMAGITAKRLSFVVHFHNVSSYIAPDVGRVNISICNRTSWEGDVTIKRDVDPKLSVHAYQLTTNQQIGQTLFKSTFKWCNLSRLVKGSPIMTLMDTILRESTNLPVMCPIPSGNYYMKNMHVDSSMVPLRMFYRGNIFHAVDAVFWLEGKRGKKFIGARTYIKLKITKL